jgi:hypothetical protein
MQTARSSEKLLIIYQTTQHVSLYIYTCPWTRKQIVWSSGKTLMYILQSAKTNANDERFLYTSVSNLVTQWSQFSSLPRPKWISWSEGHLLKQTGAYIRHGPDIVLLDFEMASYAVTCRTGSRRNWKTTQGIAGDQSGSIFYCFFVNSFFCLFAWLNFPNWRWRQYIFSRFLWTFTRIHGVTSSILAIVNRK